MIQFYIFELLGPQYKGLRTTLPGDATLTGVSEGISLYILLAKDQTWKTNLFLLTFISSPLIQFSLLVAQDYDQKHEQRLNSCVTRVKQSYRKEPAYLIVQKICLNTPTSTHWPLRCTYIHTSSSQTLCSPVLIGTGLSVETRICVWNIGSAQKPLCMKPWNAHMEHVIEWETVSCWIRQFSGTIIKA